MTNIVCEFDHGNMVAITVSGHSGYGVKGSDIVCAGISALIQALAIGLEEVLRLKNVESIFRDNVEEPIISIRFPISDEKAEILTKTVFLSLMEIAKAYPDNVRITEVQK